VCRTAAITSRRDPVGHVHCSNEAAVQLDRPDVDVALRSVSDGGTADVGDGRHIFECSHVGIVVCARRLWVDSGVCLKYHAMMIDLVLDTHRRDLGGFEVGRVLPQPRLRSVGPFVFFDHMGPVDFPAGIPRSVDVRPHPHIGLATVTYLFDGEIMHRDSLGSQQPIRPGEVNWMTAGRGITHSERFERARAEGGRLHGIQAWVALPQEHEEVEPAFAHQGIEGLPTYEGGGLWARLVAGEAFGARASVRTHSPLFYIHWEISAGAEAELPAQYPERAAYVVRGQVEIGGDRIESGRMVVFSPGRPIRFKALEKATVMLLGGEPLGPRFIEWNFVSSSKERIEQAKADWRAGRMKLPKLDDQEFIPLPGEEPAPANPMS
jgi:redox-sensitive bicupin YhaK (pirin superfamily)